MMLRSIVIFLVLTLFTCDANEVTPCASPQYVKAGETGVLQCDFSDFFGIFWYNTTDYVNSYPIVDLKGSTKSGNGFLSGEYDIHLNGSLIVVNVSWQHDRQFTVLKFDSPLDKPIPQYVQVIVVAVPRPAYPVIENCTRPNELCIKEGDSQFGLKCSVNHARPIVNVSWVEWTPDGDQNTFYQSILKQENKFGTSISTLTVSLNYTNILALFVCQVEGPLVMFEHTESAVLLQYKMRNMVFKPPIIKYIKLYSRIRLACTKNYIAFYVWKHSTSLINRFDTFAYGVFSAGKFTRRYFENVEPEENGTLTISELQIHHEGFYRCLFSDGISDEVITYEVVGIVDPAPTYLVVEGCDEEEGCELNAETEGTLKCSLSGIRPLVQLEWRTVHGSSPCLVTFKDKTHIVADRGNTFDVSLTTKYQINRFLHNKCIIECAVSGKYEDVFDLKSNVILAFNSSTTAGSQVESTKSETKDTEITEKRKWIWLISCLLVPLGFCVYMIVVRKGNRKDHWNATSMEMKHITVEEGEEENDVEDNRNETLHNSRKSSNGSLEERKSMFVKQLKANYKILYESIRPIPYIQDHMCCVDAVFVEGGIEYLGFRRGVQKSNKWIKLDTYTRMLPDELFNSTRRVLEADPGYGKSTTTLQIAFDWCNTESDTDFLYDKILILLRLRQLKGVSSIYTAIRKFILPNDSPLKQQDVRDILQQNISSVVFLLDGYDEYPYQESSRATDITHILLSNMFQESTVILTTRKFCLPKQFDPSSVRMRMTGFDDSARERYLRKAVVDNDKNAVQLIVRRFQVNPILYDLSHIPLFFVMIAHITHEQQDSVNFSSVTILFDYMIKCFHSHMDLKLLEENVANNKSYEAERERHDRNLAKLAFDGLSGRTQKIVWKKKELCEIFGKDFVEFYQRVGFFVREEMSVSNYDPEIRFYHKLFCEWFAAHFIVQDLKTPKSASVKSLFRNMNPSDLQFVYRFVCGLRPDLALRVIKYLKDEYTDIAILCLLELSTNVEEYKTILTQLLSPFMTIKNDDNRLLQRAKIHLLEGASNEEMPIQNVILHECFQDVHRTSCNIVLKSDLHLFPLNNLYKMEICEVGRTFTVEEFMGMLKFGVGCRNLERIKFSYCVLPFVIDVKSLETRIKFTVKWNSYGILQCKVDFGNNSWQEVRGNLRTNLKWTFGGEMGVPLTREKYVEMVKNIEKTEGTRKETA